MIQPMYVPRSSQVTAAAVISSTKVAMGAISELRAIPDMEEAISSKSASLCRTS